MTDFRLILDGPMSGEVNMATDEAMLDAVISDPGRPPTLRIYSWSQPTVSVGYHQDAADMAAHGLPVVRRVTGGRAVLHHMEVTYSVVAPVSLPVFSGGINGSYSMISRCIVAALASLGIKTEFARVRNRPRRSAGGRSGGADPACFHTPSRYEVMAAGRKLVGSAQRRFKEAFLQHGSIIVDVDLELSERIFGDAVTGRMNWLKSISEVDARAVASALVLVFEDVAGCRFSETGLDEGELASRDALVAGKFSDPHWYMPAAGDSGKGALAG